MLRTMFSDYTIEKYILKKAIVLVDTREKENGNPHILEWFRKKEIPFEERQLPFGDYGLYIPKNPEYGIGEDLLLDYTVERKGSLEELSGNFTADRTRLENEFIRCEGKMDLVVEGGSLSKILSGQYNTKYDRHAYLAGLFTFHHRYGIGINFVEKEFSPQVIYALLYYRLRNEIKGE